MKTTDWGIIVAALIAGMLVGALIQYVAGSQYQFNAGREWLQREAIKAGTAAYVGDKETGAPVFYWRVCNPALGTK